MTDINLSELFGSSGEKLNTGDVDRGSNYDNLITQLNTLKDVLSDEDRTFNAFGSGEEFIFGSSNDPEKNNFIQQPLRVLSDLLDPELANARSIKATLGTAFFKEVAAALEGQGQVSDFERKAGTANITTLDEPGISDEFALAEVRRMSEALSFKQWREREKINITSDGFETQNGKNVMTLRDETGKIVTQEVDKPTIVVKPWMKAEQAQDIANRVGPGSQIYYKGKFYGRPESQ